MSIELEYALEHKNDPAVLCCRMEPGEISHHNLEDPAIFPDLVDTGLLKLDRSEEHTSELQSRE